MKEQFDEERDALVERFKRALVPNAIPDYFTERDLIEIFDYAGDIDDDYIRAEVLFYGAQHFPESIELRQRRGCYLAATLPPDYWDDVVDTYLSDSSILSQLERISLNSSDRDEVQNRLKTLLSQCPKFDDEETIKFINVASENHLLDWVYKNLEPALAATSNENILLYELGTDLLTYADIIKGYNSTFQNDDSYDMNKDMYHTYYDYASHVLSLLVEKIPFEASYWASLARAQYFSKHYHDKYESSLEIALALDPDNVEALLLKANIFAIEGTAKRHKKELRDICDKLPDYGSPLMLYYDIMSNTQKNGVGIEILTRLIKDENFASWAMTELILRAPMKSREYYADFEDNADEPTDKAWLHVLCEIYTENAKETKHIIAHIRKTCEENGEDLSRDFYVTAIDILFYLQEFDMMHELIDEFGVAEHAISILYTVIAYVKKGEYEAARRGLVILMQNPAFLQEDDTPLPNMEILMSIGASAMVYELNHKLKPENIAKFNPKTYNPFGFWS